MREVLEKILPEPLLAAHTGMEYGGKKTPADLIEDLSKSDDKTDRLVAEYFTIDERYMEADTDCVQATLQLMKRGNVVFLNPFYRDMSLYITLPLTNALLSGRKCLVITGRKNNSEDVKNWLAETLSEYSHMRSLWRVELLDGNEPDCEGSADAVPEPVRRHSGRPAAFGLGSAAPVHVPYGRILIFPIAALPDLLRGSGFC